VCAGAGTVAGVLLGRLSGLVFAYAFLVPVTLGVTVAAGALLAWYTARRDARV
jgi:hypothetical protein